MTFRRTRSNPEDNRLGVWTNGERVGTWSITGSEHMFQYDESWPVSPASRPLSLSLPFTPQHVPHRGEMVRNLLELHEGDFVVDEKTGTFRCLLCVPVRPL